MTDQTVADERVESANAYLSVTRRGATALEAAKKTL